MPQIALAIPSFGVLIVESGSGWVAPVADCLRREGIPTTMAGGGAHALPAIVVEARPDMIILEAGSSPAETLATCRTLRSVSDAHIAVLTADSDTATMIDGFDTGIDEVFAEPLRTDEIVCQVRTLLNHPRGGTQTGAPCSAHVSRRFGPLTIDVQRRLVFVSGEQIQLTRTQFDILVALSHRAGGITTRQELLNAVWGPGWQGNPGVIDVHIGHLRRKLGDDPSHPTMVVNVRGVGYRLPRSR